MKKILFVFALCAFCSCSKVVHEVKGVEAETDFTSIFSSVADTIWESPRFCNDREYTHFTILSLDSMRRILFTLSEKIKKSPKDSILTIKY